MATEEESLDDLFSRVSSKLGWEQFGDTKSAITHLSAKKSTAKKSRLKKMTNQSAPSNRKVKNVEEHEQEGKGDQENESTKVRQNKLSLKKTRPNSVMKKKHQNAVSAGNSSKFEDHLHRSPSEQNGHNVDNQGAHIHDNYLKDRINFTTSGKNTLTSDLDLIEQQISNINLQSDLQHGHGIQKLCMYDHRSDESGKNDSQNFYRGCQDYKQTVKPDSLNCGDTCIGSGDGISSSKLQNSTEISQKNTAERKDLKIFQESCEKNINLSGDVLLDLTNDEIASPRLNLMDVYDEKMNDSGRLSTSSDCLIKDNSGIIPLHNPQDNAVVNQQAAEAYPSSDDYLSVEDLDCENPADLGHISICSEGRGSSSSEDEQENIDEVDVIDTDEIFREWKFSNWKLPDLDFENRSNSSKHKDEKTTENSSADEVRNPSVNNIPSNIPDPDHHDTIYDTEHREHKNAEDSDSDDDFEKFLVKAKTPNKVKKEPTKSLEEFIVSDDEVSSGSDDSALFYIHTDKKINIPKSKTDQQQKQASPRCSVNSENIKRVKQSTAKAISRSLDETSSPKSLRERLFKIPRSINAGRQKSVSSVFNEADDDEFKTSASDITFRTPQPLRPPVASVVKSKTKTKNDNIYSSEKFVKPNASGSISRSLTHSISSSVSQSLTQSISSSLSRPLTHSFLRSLAKDINESRRHPDAVRYVNDFKKSKEQLVSKLFNMFNKTVFDGKMPADFSITWNARLRKTAGYCSYKRNKAAGNERSCRIELSVKVCDSPDRVRDTLIHELCHAAVWLVNGHNDGHGPYWKYWARKANIAHPELPIIQRCHSYEINTKYIYRCTMCGYQVGRHSKSLNTEKKVCGRCMGTFELLVSDDKGVRKTPVIRTPNRFAQFVKENYASVKQNNASLTHKEIMNQLSLKFASVAKIST